MWQHSLALIDDDNLKDLATQQGCAADMTLNKCTNIETKGHTGNILACLLDHREDISNDGCRAFVQKLEWVAFTDFKLIAPFADVCKYDIDKHKCGRLPVDEVCSYIELP